MTEHLIVYPSISYLVVKPSIDKFGTNHLNLRVGNTREEALKIVFERIMIVHRNRLAKLRVYKLTSLAFQGKQFLRIGTCPHNLYSNILAGVPVLSQNLDAIST